MILYKLLIILSTIVVALIVALYMWINTLEKRTPPIKPENVPVDAVWAGGTDGGGFFLLRSEFSDTSRFTIYFDNNIGSIWYDGYFYCNKSDFYRISTMDWRELVTCYNGKYLFMKDPNDEKREIVWHKVMPNNIPDTDDVYWVDGENGGWFFELRSAPKDTSNFVIYHGITGEVLHDGLFYCTPDDFERILEEMNWNSLLQCYDSNKILMKAPDNKGYIIWHQVE